ncbi:unnamed protein product, partial [Musa hybrid cultivar]
HSLSLVFPLISARGGSTRDRGRCDQGGNKSRVEPRVGGLACCGRTYTALPPRKLCALYVCTEDPSAKKEEANLKKEVEEGKAQTRGVCTWRVNIHSSQRRKRRY